MSVQQIKPTQQNGSYSCTLLLFTEENISALQKALHTIKTEQYVPLSIRELFLYRRGVLLAPRYACAIVLYALSEQTLCRMIPVLRQYGNHVILAYDGLYSAKMNAELLNLSFINVIPTVSAFDACCDICADAVFATNIDASLLKMLRKRGVRMLLTDQMISLGCTPSGLDVLSVAKAPLAPLRKHDLNELSLMPKNETKHILLPIDPSPIFSEPALAIPLCILGTKRHALQCCLTDPTWETVYDMDQETYKTAPSRWGIIQSDVSITNDPVVNCRLCLSKGEYVLLQTKGLHIPGARLQPRQVLLFGYDGICDTFSAMTFLSHGTFDRIDLRAETLQNMCTDSEVSACTLSAAEQMNAHDVTSFAQKLLEQKPSVENICYGREAAVRFANRFYTRFSDSNAVFSASALRTFLEERRRVGYVLDYFAKREKFYTEPFASYQAVLERECCRAIEDLRGKELLRAEMPLYLTSDLMRRLLNMEEACRDAFCEECERAELRQAYLKSKHTKT